MNSVSLYRICLFQIRFLFEFYSYIHTTPISPTSVSLYLPTTLSLYCSHIAILPYSRIPRFVSWGVDYLKYDDCGEANLQSYARYMVMHDALQDAVSSSSSNHFRRNDAITYSYEPYCWHCHSPVTYLQWVPSVGDTWRSGGDIRDTWVSVLGNAIENNRWAHLARPGHQNDADMLEIGNGGLNDLEEESHFALWCLIKSPLLLAGDPRTMTAHSIAVVTNKRLLAVSADPLGIQGTLRSAAAYGANASQAALAAKIYAMQARASAQSAAESYRAAVSHAASAVAPFVAPCTYAEGGRREAKVHRNGSRLTLNHGDTLSDRSPLPSQQWILADNGTIMQLKQDGSYLCLERAVSNGSVYATGCVSGNDAPSLSGIVNSSSGNGHSDGDGADKVGSLLSSTAAAQRQMWYTGRANETLSQIRVPSISRGNTFYDKTRDTFAEHNDEASSGGQCLAFDGVHLGIKPCAVEPAACATSRCKYSALVEQLWYRSAHGQLISSFTAFSGAPPVPPQVRHSPWRRRRKYLLNHHRRRRIVASLPENMPWCLATEKSPPPKVIEPPLAVDASLPRQVWAVPLVDGSVAAVLLNAGNVTHNVTASWSALGLSSGTGASVMDLWTGKNTTISAGGGDAITLTLRPHQCAALRLTEQRHPSRGRSNIR